MGIRIIYRLQYNAPIIQYYFLTFFIVVQNANVWMFEYKIALFVYLLLKKYPINFDYFFCYLFLYLRALKTVKTFYTIYTIQCAPRRFDHCDILESIYSCFWKFVFVEIQETCNSSSKMYNISVIFEGWNDYLLLNFKWLLIWENSLNVWSISTFWC